MNDVDPELVRFWNSVAPVKANRSGRPPPAKRTARTRLTQHPAVSHQARARYLNDEADAQLAAMRVKRAPPGWDLRALRWTGRWIFRIYNFVRGFLTAHAGYVSAQKREYRLTACRGCTFRKDRGDGLMYCPAMLASCKCPIWPLACLWWVTRLRKTVCPIGHWDEPEKAADQQAAASCGARAGGK